MKKLLRTSPLTSASLLLAISIVSCTGSNNNLEPVSLSSSGIKITNPETKSATDFSFGEPAAAVSTAITSALGEPTGDVRETDCGLSLQTWPGNFSAVEKDGNFVGWVVEKSDRNNSNFTTPNGRGLGSTLADLQAASETTSRVEGDHNEFETADGYAGALNGNTPNAKVYILSSGESCDDPNYPWPQQP